MAILPHVGVYGSQATSVALDTQSQEELVTVSTYWYSMWSHRRRDLLWKGFLQVDLGPGLDAVAREKLASLDALGG